MKKFGLLVLVCFFSFVNAQEDEHIEGLKNHYLSTLNVSCDVEIIVDVEGITIPNKKVQLRFVNDELILKGEGISLLPKKGILNQFHELLSSPFQPIFLSKRGNNRVYKLVSLDDKTDWITADLEFDEDSYEIKEAMITTRKFGSFKVNNSYAGTKFPSQTIISFNMKKFKLPLKFIGRMDSSLSEVNSNEITEGKVYLNYTYLD